MKSLELVGLSGIVGKFKDFNERAKMQKEKLGGLRCNFLKLTNVKPTKSVAGENSTIPVIEKLRLAWRRSFVA